MNLPPAITPTSYSKYWRINRSSNETAELALALRAVRKVAGHIGKAVKPVYWKGMTADDGRFILLDPEKTEGEYPIPHDTYDQLVGQVVREGFLAMEFHEWVRKHTAAPFKNLDEHTMPYLDNLVTASENIYIYELVKDSIWHLYLSRFFRRAFSENTRDPALPPTAESAFAVWQGYGFTGRIPDHLHFYYTELFAVLAPYRARIRAVAAHDAMSARRKERTGIYRMMWHEVEPVVSQWRRFALNPDAVNMYDEAGPEKNVDIGEDDAENEDSNGREETEFAQGLRQGLAEEVNAYLQEEPLKLHSTAVAVDEPGARPMETRLVKGEVVSSISPDAVQVRRLRKIFKKQDSMIRRARIRHVRRGLKEGKLDPARLYRVPLDGKVFKKRQGPGEDKYRHICIVADASASMSGKEEPGRTGSRSRRPWEIAEKSFVSLAAAARGYGNVFDIYAYHAERHVCLLTRLYHGKTVYSVTPSGRTPSGQAIMAAAMLRKKSGKNRLIIHITDGAANCGLSLGEALGYCRSHAIDVVTLGCGCNRQTRDFLREFFPPGHLYFLKSIHHLSDGLEHLLRQRILQAIPK
ncbi:MAG: hypothetical protein R6U50_16975 [Desulfobacterales bacterium]